VRRPFSVLARIFFHRFSLGLLDLGGLGVFLDLGDDGVDLLHLQVDDVVQDALGLAHMLAEQVEVELSLRGEGVADVAEEVYGHQTAAVVGTQGNLAAGVGGDGLESKVGVAVRNGLTEDRVPEQDAGLGRFPCVVGDLVPQRGRVDVPGDAGIVGDNRELLGIGTTLGRRLHERVIDLDRYVGSGHLALFHLGVDEVLGVRMLDGDAHHQRASTAVLRHLARGVGVALHEGYKSGRGQGGVLDGSALGTYVRQVVAHAPAAFHQLHLLLVDADDASVRVGMSVQADDEAVG